MPFVYIFNFYFIQKSQKYAHGLDYFFHLNQQYTNLVGRGCHCSPGFLGDPSYPLKCGCMTVGHGQRLSMPLRRIPILGLVVSIVCTGILVLFHGRSYCGPNPSRIIAIRSLLGTLSVQNQGLTAIDGYIDGYALPFIFVVALYSFCHGDLPNFVTWALMSLAVMLLLVVPEQATSVASR